MNRTRLRRTRRGVALFLALVALLLLALLAVGSMHLAHADFRRSRDEATMRRAANAADAGAFDLLRTWGGFAHETLAVGATVGPDTMAFPGSTAQRWLTRLTSTTWWSVSTGVAGDSLQRTLARRTVQVGYRLAVPELLVNAALVVRDSIALAGSARVVGRDTTLAGWGALCASLAPIAAIAMPDTLRLAGGGGRAVGAPALVVDSGAALAQRYQVFGNETWASLTRRATVVLPPGSVVTAAPALAGARCDRTIATNWGDPGGIGPCARYAPLIWATGDVELRGGVGQGLLLVDGDLTLSGGARFAGIAIARDDLRSNGIGGTILGLAMAGDAVLAAGDHSQLDGQSLVQRSRCAVDLALEWSSPLVRVAGRAWAPFR